MLLGVFRSNIGPSAGAAGGVDGGGEEGGEGDARQDERGRVSLANLMATDCERIGGTQWLVWSFSSWTYSIAALPAILYMMWRLLGAAAFAGVLAFLLSNAASAYIAGRATPVQQRLQEKRDVRCALLGDFLRGVGVLKALGCEKSWGRRLQAARELELQHVRLMRYLDAAISFACGLMSQACPVAIFSWFVLVQKRPLTSTLAFTTLAWISQMQWSINSLPAVFQLRAALLPSLSRLASLRGMAEEHQK